MRQTGEQEGMRRGRRKNRDPTARAPRVGLVACGAQAGPLAAALARRGVRPLALAGEAEPPRVRDLERLAALNVDTLVVGTRVADPVEVIRRAAGVAAGVGAVLLALAPDSSMNTARDLLDAGADDIVAPPHSAAAILLRRGIVRSRMGRDSASCRGERMLLGSLELDPVSREVVRNGRRAHLSGREYELMAELGRAEGRVVRRRELIQLVWGAGRGSASALDATVHRLRRSLEEDGLPASIVETVRGVGYRLDPTILGAREG